MAKSLVASLALGSVLLGSRAAYANDPAAAEVLFQEGRRLMAEGQIGAGCEKLKESFALDPMSGTLLNLADCYEKQGRMATAWARFQNAASLAKSQGKLEQAAEANRRLKSLEGQLSYLTIQVPEPVPGLEVRRDDVEVTPGSYGVQVPVDPGSVIVVASAPGYRTVKLSVEIGNRRDKKSVTVPRLDRMEKGEAAEPAGLSAIADDPPPREEAKQDQVDSRPAEKKKPAPAVEEPARDPEPEADSGGINAGPAILGGIGLALAATGGVFGYLAMQSDRDAELLCKTHRDCSQAALDAADKRDTQATIANVGIGVGLAAIAASAAWLIFDGSSRGRESAQVTLQPAVAPGSAGLWAAARF